MRSLLACALGIACLYGGQARATHKGWILQQPGSDCSENVYSVSLGGHGAFLTLDNVRTDSDSFVTCPVQLAGRWGSLNDNGTVNHEPQRWAKAGNAKVTILNNNPGATFDCLPRARFKNSTSTFFGSLVQTTQGGVRDLVLANNNWNGNLEAQQALELRSLDYDCRIPPKINGASSAILNYRVKMCSNPSNGECEPSEDVFAQSCDDITGSETCQDWIGDVAYVQTSAIECMTGVRGYDQGALGRGFSGIQNGSQFQQNPVFCPIRPPSDESHRHQRFLQETKVYFTGNGTVSCSLYSLKLSGSTLTQTTSAVFTQPFGASYVTQTSRFLGVGLELDMGVFCWIDPGITINGVTALVSESSVTSGL